mgnify:FL=1
MLKRSLDQVIEEAIHEELGGEFPEGEAEEVAPAADPEKRFAKFVAKAAGDRKLEQAEFLELLEQVASVIRELEKEKTGEEVPEGLQGAWISLENLDDAEIEARLPEPEPAPEGASPEGEAPEGEAPEGEAPEEKPFKAARARTGGAALGRGYEE